MVRVFLLLLISSALFAAPTMTLTGNEGLVRTFSTFDEMQEGIGGQILSLFHKMPTIPCGKIKPNRIWTAPFGNWLREGNIDNQIGFVSLTKGMAAGYDYSFSPFWSFGVAGGYNESDVTLHLGKGSGNSHRYFGGIYSDLVTHYAYLGMSAYGAYVKNSLNVQNTFKRDRFLFPNRPEEHEAVFSTHGRMHTYESGMQLRGAWFFGPPVCLFYPYINFDLLFASNSSFSESGSFKHQRGTIHINVDSRLTSAIRSEAGVALTIQDTNYSETMCISPTFALGWAMECPILRPDFDWEIEGVNRQLVSKGWNQTWQLFTFEFGLKFVYLGYAISGSYHSEIAPDGRHDSFWEQWGNVRLSNSF